MFSTFLNTVVASSAFGGLVLGIFNLWNARSATSVTYRWELDHEYADVPYLVSSENFQVSLRNGLAYLLPGADDIYAHPVKLRIVVRADRRGTTPETIEYVELGDVTRRVSFDRQPGMVGSAVRTLDPNSHFEWKFDFDSIARQLSHSHPASDFPEIAIRLSNGGTQRRRFLDAPVIPAAEVRAVVEACQKVWPNYPNSKNHLA
jgi:hypothetical protein